MQRTDWGTSTGTRTGMIRRRAAAPGRLAAPLLSWPGHVANPPTYTHSCYPNDFTDPDCLLGKKVGASSASFVDSLIGRNRRAATRAGSFVAFEKIREREASAKFEGHPR